MRKSKIYLITGFIALQLGACMIHCGLGLMLLGGIAVVWFLYGIQQR